MSPSSESKTCTKCGEAKLLTAFYADRRSKDGRGAYCKDCSKAKTREWDAANPERSRAIKRRAHYKHSYGLTVEQWDRMYAAQAGMCLGCEQPLEEGKNTHVDHCHTTGAIRSLLCHWCNAVLGNARDDPARLVALAGYLIAHGTADPRGRL